VAWYVSSFCSTSSVATGSCSGRFRTNTVRHLVVGAGKDGKIYLVDRDNMGKFNSTKNNIWQEVGALGGGIYSSPAYFNGNLHYGPIGGGPGAKSSWEPPTRSGSSGYCISAGRRPTAT
jgi:hypothetical protein